MRMMMLQEKHLHKFRGFKGFDFGNHLASFVVSSTAPTTNRSQVTVTDNIELGRPCYLRSVVKHHETLAPFVHDLVKT